MIVEFVGGHGQTEAHGRFVAITVLQRDGTERFVALNDVPETGKRIERRFACSGRGRDGSWEPLPRRSGRSAFAHLGHCTLDGSSQHISLLRRVLSRPVRTLSTTSHLALSACAVSFDPVCSSRRLQLPPPISRYSSTLVSSSPVSKSVSCLQANSARRTRRRC
jgi:hypothetical protein